MMNKVFLIFYFLVIGQCFGQYSPDSIRITHIQWGIDQPIPQGFLTSAKANGYNYILCELSPFLFTTDFDDKGNILGTRPTCFEKRLTLLFQQVDDAGLKLIPHLQTCNPHAGYYTTRINKSIPRQRIHRNLPGATATDSDSYVMSPDKNNAGANLMNKAFDSLWTMVFNAFDNAKISMKYKKLDFVHLGFDENWYSWKNDPLNHLIPLVGLCGPDTAWLKAQGLKGVKTEIQIQRLYAANINKRVKDILTIANAKSHKDSTKAVLLWADMFDPYLCPPDVYSFKNLFDTKLQSNNQLFDANDSSASDTNGNLIKIRITGAIKQPDMLSVKDNLILIPWVYGDQGRNGPYVPKNVIDTFISAGYKVLYACSNGGAYLYNDGHPIYDTCKDAAIKNAFEFAIAAHDSKFTTKSIGYISTAWSDIWTVSNLLWNPDSNYIKPFTFMGIMTRIHYRRTSDSFR